MLAAAVKGLPCSRSPPTSLSVGDARLAPALVRRSFSGRSSSSSSNLGRNGRSTPRVTAPPVALLSPLSKRSLLTVCTSPSRQLRAPHTVAFALLLGPLQRMSTASSASSKVTPPGGGTIQSGMEKLNIAEESDIVTSGAHFSFWTRDVERVKFTKLDRNLESAVTVIGAGFTGLQTAYHLAKEGINVIVLEDGEIASGESGRTTAHLMSALDDHFTELRKYHGQKGAALAAHSHLAAIDDYERISREEKIDCDFERLDGYYFNVPEQKFNTETLQSELQASQDAGLFDAELVPRAPLRDYDTGPALRYPRQGAFHPVKYLNGLADALKRMGVQIFTQTHVQELNGGTPCVVETREGYRVSSQWIVQATNVPINNKLHIHASQEPYRSYVVAAPIPKKDWTPALYWDLDDPYHYARVANLQGRPDELLLIVGGEDHKVGMELDNQDERYRKLEKWMRDRWPTVGAIEYKWTGQVVEPVDGMAFIGQNPGDHKNVLISTGDSGNGVTHAAVAGILLTDIILGRPNAWQEIYSPSRMPSLRTVPEMLSHDTEINLQYKDYLLPGSVSDIEEIPRCSGAILRQGLHKLAVYRDESGVVHSCSAVCPHLKGIVRWNADEKSWDCPVHGSRFNAYGHVINGPAKSNLPPADVKGASSSK